jgi:hypothetical protein
LKYVYGFHGPTVVDELSLLSAFFPGNSDLKLLERGLNKLN